MLSGMLVSNFAFLQAEFLDRYNAAIKAEAAIHSDAFDEVGKLIGALEAVTNSTVAA